MEKKNDSIILIPEKKDRSFMGGKSFSQGKWFDIPNKIFKIRKNKLIPIETSWVTLRKK